MTDQIIDGPAGERLESSRVPAEMPAGQDGAKGDEVGCGVARMTEYGDVELDGAAMRGVDWAFGEGSALTWRRSSAESGHAGAAPVVTVKRRRVSVPPID